MMIVPFMPQIGSYCNNHLIIHVCVFFKIRRKGGERFSAFCYFTQKNNEPTKSFWSFMLQIVS